MESACRPSAAAVGSLWPAALPPRVMCCLMREARSAATSLVWRSSAGTVSAICKPWASERECQVSASQQFLRRLRQLSIKVGAMRFDKLPAS